MNHKEITLYFGDSFAGFEAELHGFDTISIVLTEFQKNEEKSSFDHDYIETRFTTEVFVGVDEAKSIIKALQYLVDENDRDAS